MAYVQMGNELGMKLCKIFGFDPYTIKSITLKIDPRSVVIAQVEKFISDKESMEIEQLIAENKDGIHIVYDKKD